MSKQFADKVCFLTAFVSYNSIWTSRFCWLVFNSKYFYNMQNPPPSDWLRLISAIIILIAAIITLTVALVKAYHAP